MLPIILWLLITIISTVLCIKTKDDYDLKFMMPIMSFILCIIAIIDFYY